MCANSVRAMLSQQHRELFHPIEELILPPRTMHDELEIPVYKRKKIIKKNSKKQTLTRFSKRYRSK